MLSQYMYTSLLHRVDQLKFKLKIFEPDKYGNIYTSQPSYIMNANKNNQQIEILINNYDSLVDQIFRFVYFKTNKKEIAEDLTSETFLSVLKYLKENEVENLRAFLFQTARNKTIDYYRQKDRIIYSDEMVELNAEVSDSKDELNKYDAELIIKRLNLLDDTDKDILIMRFIEDLDIKEIANILDKNKIAVRVQISRALKKARKLFPDFNK